MKFTIDDLCCWTYYKSYFVDILNGDYSLEEAREDLGGLVGSEFDPRKQSAPQNTNETSAQPPTSANAPDASPQGEMPPTEIERDYTFHTSEKKLVAFTETWDEHPDWWDDLPCLCSSCRDYGG